MKLRTLLCATALLGVMSFCDVYAADSMLNNWNIGSAEVETSDVQKDYDNIINNGVLSNEAELNVLNTLINNKKLVNKDKITVKEIENSAKISGAGALYFSKGLNTGSISQSIIKNVSGGVFENNGTIKTTQDFINLGTITKGVSAGASASITVNGGNNTGTIVQSSFINESGEYTNSGSIDVTDFGNVGIFQNQSTGVVKADSIINKGNFLNDKVGDTVGSIVSTEITNQGSLINKGIIESTILNNDTNSSFTNNVGATVTINDKIVNNGNIVNDGKLTTGILNNNVGATINGSDGFLSFEEGRNQGSISQAIINQVGNSTFTNEGQITAGKFNNNGIFINSGDTSKLTINGGINSGSIKGGSVYIKDNYTNNGELEINNSDFSLASGNTIDGVGKLTLNGGSNSGDILQSDVTFASGTFNNIGKIGKESSSISNIINYGNLNNTGNIVADTIQNNSQIINDNKIIANTSLTNVGKFLGNGNLIIGGGSNSGEISQKDITINGNFINDKKITSTGSFINSADITGGVDSELNVVNGTNSGNISQAIMNVSGNFTNSGVLDITKDLTNTGSVINSSTISVANELINNKNITNKNSGTITVNKVLTNNAGANIVNERNSVIDVSANGAKMENKGTVNNSGTVKFSDASAGLENSGSFITNGGLVQDAIVANTGRLTATNGAKLNLISLNNTNGIVNILNSSDLDLSNQTGDLNGTINVAGGRADANGNLIANTITSQINDTKFVGDLNIGDGNTNSNLSISNILVDKTANLNIAHGGLLVVRNNSTVNLDDNTKDIVNGDIQLVQDGTFNLDGYMLVTGDKSTQNGGNKAYYSQTGGTLNILNNSTLKLGDSSAVAGGILNLDSTSQFLVTSEANGTSNTFLDSMAMADGSRFGAMNSGMADYNITDINVNGTNNFTIDVLGRSNAQGEHGTDRFVGDNLVGNGTINIEDWTLAGDIFGWQAPIDRDLKLDNVFKFSNISPNVQLTATKKETFTPIGWYQLNNHGGMTGNYELNLTRFNPQVYRGQVTTLAQYMNQLAIDDMLFNHSMLLPSFKDYDLVDNGAMINRLASANPVYAPYQYSKKDGGLWYRMYGTFETLQMSQGLSRVGNNAYGTIIGADFGLKDLKNGWKFMPTAYIGYNGAHQYFAGMGAYQNGGQAGFLGTWYKDNFVLGGLVYGGVYQNSMDIAGHTDNTFNYFAGASAKGAYNLRLHRDWVLQPNLMIAYNFFGQQNWHTDFGQMGMMSGTLNGINLAPGLNLIWEKETFSIYATLQYMYNLNGAVDGRAGNVSLPHLYMDRGYIQYGFGFTKRFTDRFSGYFQTVFRNVGRTGVGFQLGLNIKLGK